MSEETPDPVRLWHVRVPVSYEEQVTFGMCAHGVIIRSTNGKATCAACTDELARYCEEEHDAGVRGLASYAMRKGAEG